MRDDRVYIQHWMDFKPYDKQVKSDQYYLGLSNKLRGVIINNQYANDLIDYLDDEEIKLLSCFIAAYLEDLVSGTNLWNTFIKQHEKLYSKYLPFYIDDDYYAGEINEADVCFLIWYFTSTIQEMNTIEPDQPFIKVMAEAIMDVLDLAWEDAPENKALIPFYTIDKSEKDFYKARMVIDHILFKSYLFYPDTIMELRAKENELYIENGDHPHLLSMLNDNRDASLHTMCTRLLSYSGKEWAAHILGEEHPLCSNYLNLSKKINALFLYKGQDDNDIFIEHIATGKPFKVTKKSFDHAESLDEIDEIIFLGIVKWGDEWWFSGVFFTQEYDADLVLDQRNSNEARMAVNFLDHQSLGMQEIMEGQRLAFMDLTHDQPIVFLESEKVDTFVKSFTEHYNDSLKLSKKQKEKARQSVRDEGYFGDGQSIDFSHIPDSGLVYFNPNSGIEIVFAVNSAFPLESNPFLNNTEQLEHIYRLLMDESISKELVQYWVDNFSKKLSFFTSEKGQTYLQNLDFVLRFWKGRNYHSDPQITMIGV